MCPLNFEGNRNTQQKKPASLVLFFFDLFWRNFWMVLLTLVVWIRWGAGSVKIWKVESCATKIQMTSMLEGQPPKTRPF